MNWSFFKGADPFAPRMPDVNVNADVAELFARVREMLPRDRSSQKLKAGDPWLGIVCPDRSHFLLTLSVDAELPPQLVKANKACIPHTRPLNITAVGFTGLRPSSEICRMPFVASILPLAYIGHNIIVFEGHPSGFEAALRDADVLAVDSAMLPFLQHDWFEVARGAFRERGRIRMFDRKTLSLPPVVPSRNPSGWAYATEADGEVSYVNGLLTTLARRESIPVQLSCDARLPGLPELATSPDEIEWTTALPFDYSALNSAEVIRIICSAPGVQWSPSQENQSSGFVRMKLAEGGKNARDVSFRLAVTEDPLRGRSMVVERIG